ncbi:AraC family transcriptional regulator [Oceanobacillus halophilus]|uniref:AraC family transcriptional regulator n=1 Tax=Oceanobacillus halophilus TaxID=930130 RepID=A0A495A4A9_9BACI|nr:AraC family transcriptional regulator [Oceanobacillus halophilus]RKQ34576.1 AraC family transcriptional regulator [Oceanobacillus halophilus]
MEQSVFMPAKHQDFEIFDWSQSNPSQHTLKKEYESPEKRAEVEQLFRLHSHDVTEVLVFLSGDCTFFCEGKTYILKRGDIVVIPPYAVHQAKVTDFDSYERIMFTVSTHLMDDYVSISPTMKENIVYQKTQGSYVRNLHTDKFQEVLSLLEEISWKKVNGKETNSFFLQYLLFKVLESIFQPESSTPKTNELDERLASILDFIESHLTDPDLNLDKVSNHFHLNKYYFSHYFKNNMTLPFYRYVSLKRLSTALTMIKQNQMSIEEIAYTCGFPDYSSFYRLFKKEYNLSPKNFQKNYKKT